MITNEGSNVVSLKGRVKTVTPPDERDYTQVFHQMLSWRDMVDHWHGVLTPSETHVLATVFRYSVAFQKAECTLTYRQLSEGKNRYGGAGLRERTLREIITSLRERGVLHVVEDKRHGNTYRINFAWRPKDVTLPIPKRRQNRVEEVVEDGWEVASKGLGPAEFRRTDRRNIAGQTGGIPPVLYKRTNNLNEQENIEPRADGSAVAGSDFISISGESSPGEVSTEVSQAESDPEKIENTLPEENSEPRAAKKIEPENPDDGWSTPRPRSRTRVNQPSAGLPVPKRLAGIIKPTRPAQQVSPEDDDGWENPAPAAPVVSSGPVLPVPKVRREVRTATPEEVLARSAAKRARLRETTAPKALRATWAAAWESAHADIPEFRACPPWGKKELGQMKNFAAKFPGSAGDLHKCIEWLIEYWPAIMKKHFSSLRSKPDLPTTGFLLGFRDDLVSAWRKREVIERTRGISGDDEEAQFAKLTKVDGLTKDEAVRVIQEARGRNVAYKQLEEAQRHRREGDRLYQYADRRLREVERLGRAKPEQEGRPAKHGSFRERIAADRQERVDAVRRIADVDPETYLRPVVLEPWDVAEARVTAVLEQPTHSDREPNND